MFFNMPCVCLFCIPPLQDWTSRLIRDLLLTPTDRLSLIFKKNGFVLWRYRKRTNLKFNKVDFHSACFSAQLSNWLSVKQYVRSNYCQNILKTAQKHSNKGKKTLEKENKTKQKQSIQRTGTILLVVSAQFKTLHLWWYGGTLVPNLFSWKLI